MKKLLIPVLVLCFGLMFNACQKENLQTEAETEATVMPADDPMAGFTTIDEMPDANPVSVGPFPPFGGGPVPALDFRAQVVTTTIPGTTTGCNGVPLPDVSCQTGVRFFSASVQVDNIGSIGFLDTLTVRWFFFNGSSTSFLDQTIPDVNIPAGGSFTFTRPFFIGPCDCVPVGYGPILSILAAVDPANVYPEASETNNNTARYNMCSGC